MLARTRVAWALAIYFGCQSMVAYVVFGWLAQILTDAGMTDTAAAFQVAVAIAVGIPLAALVPPLLGRLRRPAILVVALSSCYLAAFVGLILVAGTSGLGAVRADRHRHRRVPAGADADRAAGQDRRWRPRRCRRSPSAAAT